MEVWPGVECPMWMVLLFVLAGLTYLYGVWTHTFFSSRGIPGPKPLPYLGNLADVFTKAAHVNETKWTQKFGKIYGIYLGRQPILCVHDAKIVETIMVKDFAKFCNRENNNPINPPMDKGLIFIQDDHWRRTRNIILPTFSSGKLKGMHHVIQECGSRLADRFNDAAMKDEEVDTRDLFGSYALEVITSTSFGLKVGALADKNDPFLRCVQEIFDMKLPISLLIYKCAPFLRGINDYFGLGVWPKKSIKFFDESIKDIIAQRIAKKQNRLDFLQLMLNAESEDIHNTGANKKLTLDEISAQSFGFFIAGFETTATLLTFVCYNLCRHPTIQQRVYDEMVEVLGDGEPTYETMCQLTYLGQCLNETLRMYPPIQSMSRVAKEDVTLGGFDVPRGTAIHLPFYDIMHDPNIYPDPETFNPDRFAEKRAASKPTFLAFGIGPRMCLGSRLGILESKIAMCNILRKFLLLPPKSQNELKLMPGLLMNSRQKLTVRLKRRDSTLN